MKLYIIDNYRDKYPELKGKELTDRLIEDCLEMYSGKRPEILRTSRGKPYTELYMMDSDTGESKKIHFSVSHSGSVFACIAGDVPVGIDIQHRRKASAEKIAQRYFTEDEKRYVKERGEKGFFELWTRKEAYSKLTGNGLEDVMAGFDVLQRDDVEFTDLRLEDGAWCSYCVAKQPV